MSFGDDLIETAELLCSPALGRTPSQAMLKMGVYASYQALLHCLQNMCADSFIGDESEADRPDKAWHEVYRSLQHEVLRKACGHQDLKFFPPEFRSVGSGVLNLRKARYSAGYSVMTVIEVEEAQGFIDLASDCIELIRNAQRKDKLAFAAWIVVERKGGVADARTRARSKTPTAMVLK